MGSQISNVWQVGPVLRLSYPAAVGGPPDAYVALVQRFLCQTPSIRTPLTPVLPISSPVRLVAKTMNCLPPYWHR